VKLIDLSRYGGIGSNCLLLEIGGLRVIVDAGIHPKKIGRETLPAFQSLQPGDVDLIVLTHCHLDHLGALPVLTRQLPDTPVITTPATEILAKRMLHNSCSVMERQKLEFGIGEYPLFTRSEVERTRRQMIPFQPGNPRILDTRTGERVILSLHAAGHLPGAAGLLLEHNHRKVFFTGDTLFQPTRILRKASFPTEPVETIVLETTRGSTTRKEGTDRVSETARLLRTIRDTIGRGGSILIPCFALGRMQEMIAIFNDARIEGKLPRVPIYTSGLGMDLVDHFDQIATKTRTIDFKRKWMRDLSVRRFPEGHRAGSEGPAIYLLSSGMMVENTPSYAACRPLLRKKVNTVAFVGYCDPETPGGRLLALESGEPMTLSPGSSPVEVKASIEKFDLSSHADREDLVAFALERQPRNVVLHHGDPESQDWFEEAFAAARPAINVLRPKPLETLEIA